MLITLNQLPATERNDTIHSVPFDLIPVDQKKLDADWAQRTYKYAHIFSESITSMVIQSQDDLQDWINIASHVQVELRSLGVAKAHERLLEICNEHEIKLPGNSNQRPVNIDDIMTIIGNKTWYQSNVAAKRTLIHMFAYGMFRRGYNMWAVNAANDWMVSKNIQLFQDSSNDGLANRRCGKGFVYSN